MIRKNCYNYLPIMLITKGGAERIGDIFVKKDYVNCIMKPLLDDNNQIVNYQIRKEEE